MFNGNYDFILANIFENAINSFHFFLILVKNNTFTLDI